MSCGAPQLLDVAVTAFAVLGGTLATTSGALAARTAFWRGSRSELPAAINYGIALGFVFGLVPAIGTIIMTVR